MKMLRSRTSIFPPVAVCCKEGKRTIEVGLLLYIIFTAMDSIKLTMLLNPNGKKGGTMNHHKAFSVDQWKDPSSMSCPCSHIHRDGCTWAMLECTPSVIHWLANEGKTVNCK